MPNPQFAATEVAKRRPLAGGLPLYTLAGCLSFCLVPGSPVRRSTRYARPTQSLNGQIAVPEELAETSSSRQIFLAPIRFFQKHISPIDGPRCQFSPTCSSFGHQAIRGQGLWIGGMMTADRLLRCSHLTTIDNYVRLPNGRLADPVANNLLED